MKKRFCYNLLLTGLVLLFCIVSSAQSDRDAVNNVLGAFAKAAAANPNDSSSADLTMKALGMLVGGTSLSHEDSVKAINNYKTAIGGAGVHFRYQMTTSGNKISSIRDTSQLYFTNEGEGRMEMRIPMPGVHMNQMITLGRINARKYSISLYADSKTYSLNVIDTARMLQYGGSYQVNKIGTEQVGGYSCIHSRLISTRNSRLANSASTTDIWTSTSVPGYALYSKMLAVQASQTGMLQALEKAGCGGIMVKMVVTGKDNSMEEILMSAAQEKLSADLFEIPAGYSESGGNMISHMMSPNK
jgi:hypothetical protein